MKALVWHGNERRAGGTRSRSRQSSTRATRSSRSRRTAICGSDLHLLDGYIPTMQAGDILGHEFMGEVVEVGKEQQEAEGRRPRRRAVHDRVRPLLLLRTAAVVAAATTRTRTRGWRRSCTATPTSGLFGYSHLTGGYAGGQAQYARVPFADVGPLKVPDGLTDEQVLFLSDIFPTGYMAAENCDIQRGDTIAVWGCGPVGQMAITQRVPARRRARHRDRLGARAAAAWRRRHGAEVHQLRGRGRVRAPARR